MVFIHYLGPREHGHRVRGTLDARQIPEIRLSGSKIPQSHGSTGPIHLIPKPRLQVRGTHWVPFDNSETSDVQELVLYHFIGTDEVPR